MDQAQQDNNEPPTEFEKAYYEQSDWLIAMRKPVVRGRVRAVLPTPPKLPTVRESRTRR